MVWCTFYPSDCIRCTAFDVILKLEIDRQHRQRISTKALETLSSQTQRLAGQVQIDKFFMLLQDTLWHAHALDFNRSMEIYRMSHNPQKPCRTSISRSLNTAEAAEMLGIRPATLRCWKSQRVGPPFIQLSPRCVRYAESDIRLFAEERRVVPCVRETGKPNAAL